ncbi:MAG: ATP-binding protein [Halorubrum sp.]
MSDSDRRDRDLRRYETILNAIDDAVYAVRPDGTIAYVNDRYVEMKGATREELLGTNIYDWVTDETAAKASQTRREAAAGERDRGAVEYEFLTADGEKFPVEMRFSFVTGDAHTDSDDARDPKAFEEFDRVGVIRDIRDQRRREEALRRKNERLEEFASIVSHDLRNPLNVATGRLELALDECDSEHLDEVARAHERMESLIEDLLTLARDGAELEDLEPIRLDALVTECWEGVDTADATLRLDADRTIRADRSRLRQLLENLVRNAIDHGGGDVAITVGTVDDDGAAGFFVADDGTGIPETDRETVFETGYSTAADGTGFGLSIVESVAEAHGWNVRVTDADDGGARFEFTGVEVLD